MAHLNSSNLMEGYAGMHSNLEVTVNEEQTKNLYGKTHHVTVLDCSRMFYNIDSVTM